ncbi:MAG: hypothetical protein GX946_07525 [Oligosphaeraceae bacterium]|nr:hypothetical protein [Oligosphaeraceae bacterium]
MFSDDTVKQLRQHGGVLQSRSGIALHLAHAAGFCQGVAKAMEKLSALLKNAPANSRKLLLGEMIHNESVNHTLIDCGVELLTEEQSAALFAAPAEANTNTKYIIPAFGLSLELEEPLRQHVLDSEQILDCCCPNVRRIWQQVEKFGVAGRALLLHGSPGHQEVLGIWSRIRRHAKAGALLPTPDSAQKFLQAAAKSFQDGAYPAELLWQPHKLIELPWTLINQTTVLRSDCRQIAELLAAARRKDRFTWVETTCIATRQRQEQAEQLCREGCDIILVVGSPSSSNTNKLYLLAAKHAKSFFVSSDKDIEQETLRHYLPDPGIWRNETNWLQCKPNKICILSGASCPDSLLGAVIRKLARY